jgi:cytochrome c-type biogenesis protein CcmH/NrfG
MTDLCDEPNAEQNCEAAIKEALKVDSNNVDALQSLANLRMIRDKDDEAKVHLTKVF